MPKGLPTVRPTTVPRTKVLEELRSILLEKIIAVFTKANSGRIKKVAKWA